MVFLHPFRCFSAAGFAILPVFAPFYTARLVVPVGEHTLKIGPELFYSRMFRVFFAKVTVIGNVPPVTFTCPFT
jgi:hypothetical protein